MDFDPDMREKRYASTARRCAGCSGTIETMQPCWRVLHDPRRPGPIEQWFHPNCLEEEAA